MSAATLANDVAVTQSFLDAVEGVAYLVEEDGQIVAVGEPAWSRFGREGGVGDLHPRSVIGRSLFDMIAGQAVRGAYKRLHALVIAGERPHVAFEFRCDAPDKARRMRMSMSRLQLAGKAPRILYQSQLLSVVERPWMSLFEARELKATASSSGEQPPLLGLCSFCQRVSWKSRWVAPETYYREGGVADVQISHGVCGDCVEELA